jgi:superfamily II DNA or RNA helicase
LGWLPWNNAQYQQLLGRLVRKGQISDVVHVYIVKAKVSGYPYDELKWNRILFKRTSADCAEYNESSYSNEDNKNDENDNDNDSNYNGNDCQSQGSVYGVYDKATNKMKIHVPGSVAA